MLNRKYITITLFFALSFGLAMWTVQSFIPQVNAVPLADLHSSILIDGNAELDAFCSGNGTSGNFTHPHVIENFEIGSDGPQNGIKLMNIDRYLIIRDVNVTGFSQSSNSRGIFLMNCTNIDFIRCLFTENSYGIVFENVNFTRLIDSSGSYNYENGITFQNCHNNTLYNTAVLGNGLKENDGNGMNLINSNNNTIEYCLFIENRGHGLSLQDSFHNTVFDSTFLYNFGDCISNPTDPEGTNNFYNNSCKGKFIPGAPVGIIMMISLGTVVILVIVTIQSRKKTQNS